MNLLKEIKVIVDNFSVPKKKVFTFPRDHGSHNDFQFEWWYLVGHLKDKQKDTYSFQLTFFRISKVILNGQSINHYIAHSALLDKRKKIFFEERMASQNSSIYYSPSNLDIRFEDWKLMLKEDMGTVIMHSSINRNVFLNLNFKVIKPPVSFGKNGVYRKGGSSASHYVTFPRLKGNGTVRIEGYDYEVEGAAWLDHEFGNKYLDNNQEGWDWACIQLDTGQEIMVYRLRRSDGSTDSTSSLTWILENGDLKTASFNWVILNRWKSPHTGIDYPINVRINTGNHNFELRPLIEDQERIGTHSNAKYWEGSCKVLDTNGTVVGRSFLELTGYS